MRQPFIFAQPATIHEVVLRRETQTKKALAEISEEKLRGRSIEDVISELVERFRLEVPVLDQLGINELEGQEVDIDVSGTQNRAFLEPGPHYVKGTSVGISIPFVGEPKLFGYAPSNFGNQIPAEIAGNTIVLRHAAEHPSRSEIRHDFESRLALIETVLGLIRGPAEEWNRRLPDIIRTELTKRKEKIERDRGFTLGYPKAPIVAKPDVTSGKIAQPLSDHFDLFLSHASEDKESIARPLYKALISRDITVWFDDAVLRMGDSLRRRIDDGLARCNYGIVIISPSFLSKEWPQRELDGLVAREVASGKKAILPIWHQIDQAMVMRYSPTLADRLAGRSEEGSRRS